LRARELRELSDEELIKRLAETREELFNLRFQAATGALDNTARLGLTKRDIARILSIQAERAGRLERR
jgi:large subunit ribosomal protein L29